MSKSITITGLSIQFDFNGSESEAKDIARQRIKEINDLLQAANDDAQIFGGDDIDRSQIEIEGDEDEDDLPI